MILLVKDILNKYIDEDLGIPRVKEELMVSKAWDSLCIKGVSDNSVFDKLIGGTLYLNVKNSAWAQQINMIKTEIISKLNEQAGQRIVNDVRVSTCNFEEHKPSEISRPEKKCTVCGVSHFYSGELCPVCEREEKRRSLSLIYRCVDDNPKVSLMEARKILPGLGMDDFRRIKRNMNSYKADPKTGKGAELGRKKSGA